jgi:hypothetical protein
MKGNIKDIMNGSSSNLDEQVLMDYLEGKLAPEKVHEVEKMMANSGFLDDAVEGLSQMKDKQRIASVLQELNSKLHTKTQMQKKKFSPYLPGQQTMTMVVLITILLLVTLAFVIYKMSQS